MNSGFPVTYSLVSSEALEKKIVTLYNLPPASRVVFLHQGLNDTYLINTPEEKFILRIYRTGWKTIEDIHGELELLLMLHKTGISVSYPLADKEGKFIQQLDCPEGIRFAVVFTYAAGESLPCLNEQTANLFGQYLAGLHKITANLKIEKISRKYTVTDILGNTRQQLQSPTNANEAYRQIEIVCNLLEEKLNINILKKVRSGICHGDPHYENLFLDHSSGRITLFDFDFCGYGYFLYDLGSFCRYERNNQSIKNSFFEGYEKVLPLTETEKKLLPYFEVLMRVFHLGARVQNADGIKNPKWLEGDVIKTIQNIQEELSKLCSEEKN